jgi:hypothetical protein
MIRQDPTERPSSIRAIKDELHIRGVEFVTHQKLDQVRKTVVPATTPDDPLGGVDVAAVAFSFDSGTLSFQLEPPPPPEWMHALRTLERYRSYGLAEPERVQWTARGAATVPAEAKTVVEVGRMVREWVFAANAEYHKRLITKAKEEERREREALAARKRELEEQALAMENLRKAQLA